MNKYGVGGFKKGYDSRRGRQKRANGYIALYSPQHPFAKNNRVFEHRLVMEKHIGRYLLFKEVVHHINKIVSDNRIENLMLFSSTGEHIKFHHKLKREGKRDYN